MSMTVFVVDNAKCLHDLLDVLGEQTVVAPTNHASTSNTYGAASTTEYGHVMLTNEGQGSAAWDDPSTYLGKAVSGTDGKILNDKIAQNASDIAILQSDVQSLQDIAELPVGTILISDAQSASQMAQRMGYGTWINIKSEQIESGGTTYYAEYYYRSA